MNTKKTSDFLITADDAGQRADIFLSAVFPEISRSYIQKQIKLGNVLVNSTPAKSSQILKIDDEISAGFEQSSLIEPKPENNPVEIIYEDDTMAVINKPSGMLTHPTSTETSGTLVNALLNTFDSLSDCNGKMRPGIVHRLDRNTSGLLMIAKTNEAYEFLKDKMQKREITKKYYAVVSGNLQKDSGSITSSIGRHPSKPEKMAIRVDGKTAITHYKVIERLSGYTFLDISIETGRTHQIRVHFSSLNHPIVNDSLYGGAKLPVKTTQQALQAYSLTFVSPYDLKERTITIDTDNDIMKTLNYLRNKQ